MSGRFLIAVLLSAFAVAANAQRARDLGIPFEGTPGPLNAITDVAGVTVGHSTLIRDTPDGHAVRTGVTAILPRGRDSLMEPVMAATFALNGNGEMTGAAWVEESGLLEGPVMLTNTHSVGTVRDATIAWRIRAAGPDASGYTWSLPLVAETWDGDLNDINGFHVQAKDAEAALENAVAGPVAEGNVGGGTGMICHEYKCGIGTSSRIVNALDEPYTVGVLVQANYGLRDSLRIAGVPIGQHMRDDRIRSEDDPQASDTGSIIIVVATDAPLLPHQLKRLAKRAALGLARMGSIAGNGSGDIFVAFGTGNPAGQTGLQQVRMLGNEHMDPLFAGVVEATEEAIVNAMIAARDMTGEEGRYAKAIDHEQLQHWLSYYKRLAPQLDLPASIETYPDGRKPVEELYRAYTSLLEKGWQMDIVTRSQPPGREYALPIIALRTPAGGQACWIFSGIHGEEPAGPNAIAESIDAIAALGERQSVVLLPLNNPQGYVNDWRYLNMQKYSETIPGQSVGDSEHLLTDPDNPEQARQANASSPEADAITKYVLAMSKLYPPAASIDLHEDNLIDQGYVYSQGVPGAADPMALAAVQTLKENGIAIRMSGETRFGEVIEGGIIGPVIDGSIDELMSAGSVIVDGKPQAGPGAHTVLVFETPADGIDLQKRIDAQAALLKSIESCNPETR
jgi:D-aminopeptidase